MRGTTRPMNIDSDQQTKQPGHCKRTSEALTGRSNSWRFPSHCNSFTVNCRCIFAHSLLWLILTRWGDKQFPISPDDELKDTDTDTDTETVKDFCCGSWWFLSGERMQFIGGKSWLPVFDSQQLAALWYTDHCQMPIFHEPSDLTLFFLHFLMCYALSWLYLFSLHY